jgi:hypothetical protein
MGGGMDPNLFHSFADTVRWSSVCCIHALALRASFDVVDFHFDIKNAFQATRTPTPMHGHLRLGSSSVAGSIRRRQVTSTELDEEKKRGESSDGDPHVPNTPHQFGQSTHNRRSSTDWAGYPSCRDH